jgi:Tfp pilus assembly protein PilV
MSVRRPKSTRAMKGRSSERGFTLLETAIALVIMMVVALGVASLFVYSANINSGANDREVAAAIAQKRIEWLRNVPFSAATRDTAYSYPDGGLGVTPTAGISETETLARRTYTVLTKIENTSVVPAGKPDAGEPTVKTITITVTPQAAGTALGSVRLSTQRSTLVPGTY